MKKINYFYIVFFLILVFSIYYLSRNFSFESLKKLTPQITILIIILTLAPTLLNAYGIKVLLKDMGHKTSFAKLFYIIRSSLFIEYITPLKLSAPLLIYLYNKFQKIPIAVGTAVTVVELLLTLLLSSLISILAIATIFTGYSIKLPLIVLGIIIMISGIILISSNRIKNYENKLIKKILYIKDKFQDSIRSISLKSIILFLLITFVMLFFSALRLSFILSIFDAPKLGIINILYIFTLSFLIGGLSFIPGGLGVKDASLTLLLVQLSIPLEVAVAVALIERTVTMVVSLLLGIFSISMLGIKDIKQSSSPT